MSKPSLATAIKPAMTPGATLVAVGLLERDPSTRKYRLMDAG